VRSIGLTLVCIVGCIPHAYSDDTTRFAYSYVYNASGLRIPSSAHYTFVTHTPAIPRGGTIRVSIIEVSRPTLIIGSSQTGRTCPTSTWIEWPDAPEGPYGGLGVILVRANRPLTSESFRALLPVAGRGTDSYRVLTSTSRIDGCDVVSTTSYEAEFTPPSVEPGTYRLVPGLIFGPRAYDYPQPPRPGPYGGGRLKPSFRVTSGRLPLITVTDADGVAKRDERPGPGSTIAECRPSAERVDIEMYLTGEVCAPPAFPYSPQFRRTKAGIRAADPFGDCSSEFGPIGPGDTGRSFNFTDACDTHDYGYDLLRFFDIGGDARRDVDKQFSADLAAACADRGFFTRYNCRDWADAFAIAIRANSLRQWYKPPTGEIGSHA